MADNIVIDKEPVLPPPPCGVNHKTSTTVTVDDQPGQPTKVTLS